MKAKIDVVLVPWGDKFEVHLRSITISDLGVTQIENEGQLKYMVKDYVDALFDSQLDIGLITVSERV